MSQTIQPEKKGHRTRKNGNFAKQNGDSGVVDHREISPAIRDLETNQVMSFKIIVYIYICI